MATFTIDDLTTPATKDEFKVAIYNVLAASGVTTTNWRPGAVVRTIIAAVAIVAASLSSLIATIARGGYLDKAEDLWLTLLAEFVYGVTRNPATFATGEVTLTNNGGGLYSYAAGTLILKNSGTGVTYVNVNAVNLAAGPGTTTTDLYTCTIQGADGTSFAGELNSIESPASPGVGVNNVLALVGVDEEQDQDLRVRCKERLGAISPNGPPDAYSYVAKGAKRLDGSYINVTRVRLENSGGGQLLAYVGKVDSEVTGTVGDLNTDLGCVDDAMQKLATPQCITLTTVSASAVGINYFYDVSLYDTVSATNAEIIAAIEASVTAVLAATPIGGDIQPGFSGRVYLDKIKAAVMTTKINGVPLPIFRHTTSVDATSNPFPLNINEFPVLASIVNSGVYRLPYGT